MPSRLAFLLELLLDRLELLLDIIDAGLELLPGLALLGQVLPSPGQVLLSPGQVFPQRGSLISLRVIILAILKPSMTLLKFLNLARDLSAKGIHRGPVIGGLARFPFETLTFLKSGYFFLGILDVTTELGTEGLKLGLTVGLARNPFETLLLPFETLLLHLIAQRLQAIVNLTTLVLNGVASDGVIDVVGSRVLEATVLPLPGGGAAGGTPVLVVLGGIRTVGRDDVGRLVLAVPVGVVAGSAEAEAASAGGVVVSGHDSICLKTLESDQAVRRARGGGRGMSVIAGK